MFYIEFMVKGKVFGININFEDEVIKFINCSFL